MPKKKSIEDYRAKRDFTRTPEPAPAPPNEATDSKHRVFVIHRHDARRLHYDLRLSMEGVLRSWAVPKGFSYDPAEKRLAVRTEDHPAEYEDFSGVIPRGEYGAGTMTIWDRGTYTIRNEDGIEGVDAGKLEIIFYGRRLRGEWHMVLTKAEENVWLLFKARDLYARAAEEALGGDLSTALDATWPKSVRAIVPDRRLNEPFSDPDWIFEMSFVGKRAFLRKRPEGVELRIGRKDVLPLFDDLARECTKIRAEHAILDGMLVALDEHGRPSEEALELRIRGETISSVQFYAFDLVYYEEFDLRPVPLIERKSQLASILPELRFLQYVDHVPGNGRQLADVLAQSGLTGMIAKESGSPYSGGKSKSWIELTVQPESAAKKKSLSKALATGIRLKPKDERVKFTNLKKVYWPDEGWTKGDLLGYYEQIADFILPYLVERPVHLYRFPNGIEGKSFYQHEAPPHLPDWFATEPIDSESKGRAVPHMVCNDRSSLLYLINLGSIDLHPWLSRRPDLDSPTWAVLDLDPKDAPFADVVRVARAIKKVLDAIQLTAGLKTSGSTGLHVFVPLNPGYSYAQVRMFCEGIARVIVKEHGDIATVERAMKSRKSRVYVDFGQNRQGQTVVPPYVVRPVPGATASAPLHWEELEGNLDPSLFHLRNLPQRIARMGDLFRPLFDQGQDLMPAIARLEQYIRSG